MNDLTSTRAILTEQQRETLEALAGEIRVRRPVVAFTGAGISTESGIPDYRGQNGIWKRIRPTSFREFLNDPEVRVAYWRRRRERYPQMVQVEPNAGHLALVRLQEAGLLSTIITQNIDGLHQRAGADPETVIELHGTVHEIRCLECGRRFPAAEFPLPEGDEEPVCPVCGGIVKEATISFGESLVADDLRRALDEDQFYLVYQPLVDLRNGRVTGVEALLRWMHPERGNIPPGVFIPIAEETGLINEIGEWVIRTACAQNKAWQDAGLPPFIVSVNLSMRQFHQHDLADRIRAILEETGLEPRWVGLEITESMTADVEFAYETLRKLKEVGVQISLDDFGTGYSSLSYLKRYPIDKLKIDRSFVADLERDGNDAAIVSTIAAMARHLNLRVTAEGVESEEQLRFLRAELCEEAQGFYYTRPVTADAFVEWFEEHRKDSEAYAER